MNPSTVVPNTSARPCPKCRADMLMEKSIGDSLKFRCTNCRAIFFFDPEQEEIDNGQLFIPAVVRLSEDYRPTAADCVGERCMEVR